VSEKRRRITTRFSKRDPAYWCERVFKNAYTYKGRRGQVGSWSVKIQLFGKRKSFTLSSHEHSQAADEACQIYQTILERGWQAVTHSRAGKSAGFHVASVSLPASIRYDAEYWKQRLIHRRYPEPAQSLRGREFSVWIEHARISQYFPLGTSDENEAASRAMRIYRTVANKGWAAANGCFPRELSLALRAMRKLKQLPLSSRQREVALLLALGEDSPSVQQRLGISSETLRDHTRKIYRRLDIHSRQALVNRLR